MKKNAKTTLSNRKIRLQAGQARPSAGHTKTKKEDAAIPELTFKGGLRNIILKYAVSHSAYIPFHKACEAALVPVACVWLAACTGSKIEDLCLSGSNIRSMRDLLENNIGDSDLLYVMNAYIYGVINTASLADALRLTHDYEKYITNNKSLTALQRKILLKGFRSFAQGGGVTKRRGGKEG